MASNRFGRFFSLTTWGESHGPAVGVVIDGCPSGIDVSCEDIEKEMSQRSPGNSPYTSPRRERDRVEVLSGIYENKTTGAPIALLIKNEDADPSAYQEIADKLRPGHANYTYAEKYGHVDQRGGGRSSARETVCRVAAGAIASQVLKVYGVKLYAYIKQISNCCADIDPSESSFMENIFQSSLFCPDAKAEMGMRSLLDNAIAEGDSLGGLVEFAAFNVPVGLGDPIYEKLEANLAKAMMSIPASKGFEIGSGFSCVAMKGSEHNDTFISKAGSISTKTNHAGGTLGGISTGMPIIARVAFKPTSSIKKYQQTVTFSGEKCAFVLPENARHDPCVAIRAVPVVKAMAALVLADALLMNQAQKLPEKVLQK